MKSILRLTPGGWDPEVPTLRLFRLGLWVDDKEVAHWAVNSGQPGAQTLRTYNDPSSRPGNGEPIPEAVYPLGGVEFKGGDDDWATYHSAALGPVWISILSLADLGKANGKRGEFGHHLDANRAWSPGSAGCPVQRSLSELQRFIAAVKKYKPLEQVVDYGFGTVPRAPGKESQEDIGEKPRQDGDIATVKFEGLAVGKALLADGRSYPSTDAVLGILAGLTGIKAEIKWDGKNKVVHVKRIKP